MALHENLFPLLVAAIHGEKVKPLGIEGGSVNYRLMDDGTAWIVDPSPENKERFLGHLRNMRETGHLSIRGHAFGVACEQGSPGMHWTFNVGSVLGVLKWALIREDAQMIIACVGFLDDELGLDEAHLWRNRIILPAPRVKNEKGQRPIDGNRDLFVRMVNGYKPRKRAKFWAEPQNIVAATLREILRSEPQLFAPPHAYPKLHLPILKTELPGGGFIAWIEKTPEAEHAMGRDGCNWVRCAPDGVTYGFDWSEPPTS